MALNLADQTILDRSAHWTAELIKCCRKFGIVHGKSPQLCTEVTRRAKALQTSLKKLLAALDETKGA